MKPYPFLSRALATFSLAGLMAGGVVAAQAQDMPAAPAAGAAPAAQDAPPPRQRRPGGGGMSPVPAAFKAVNPTADEQTKFDALTTTYQSDLTAARADTTDRTKVRTVTQKYTSDVEALLTPDQQTKFKQQLLILPVMANLRRLALTADEKTKIEPILTDYATKAMDMKPKERTPLQEDAKTKIRAVLTPDQQTTFDTMTPFGGGRRQAAPPPAN